ncbi:putative manganese-dependent inorganic diphosphatase [Eubacterium sp. 1001713B170207_170306_E7]|uniref:putative manganese-dependent inorganic diphosphatase n=1 Tax=Eubacterium sp. 1001713B170207_170306_E7 TaxID=2787097 RepID=UPI001899872B|nr:putative manganese-dependent inorganic diphosphatase [Eubacterium sp. 1001713B170207_170306_E7]
MAQAIYVFGHQNPDTDSICASLSYAYLKQAIGNENVVACRLGNINKETKYVLDYFNVEPPKLIKSVKPQVSDLHFNNFSMATEQDSVLKTMNQIISNPGRSLPVVDADKKLLGIISLPDIIQAYTDPYVESILKDTKTPYKNIIEILDARIIGDIPYACVTGNVYTNTELVAGQKLNAEDFVVTALNDGSLGKAFETGAENIIISNTPIGKLPPIPESYKGLVFLSNHSPFEVIRLLTQVIPITNFVKRENLEYFVTYETIDDVKENMLTSNHTRFPVVSEDGMVLASITKSNLLDYNRKQVILVDHNERGQSIRGVEEAEIIEVIDHHRVAEIQTATPLYLRIEPVGCTCTIVAKMYHERNIPIPRPMAGVMLSAIISDTLLFHSPTCTETDRKIAEELADIAGVDLKAYGENMLVAGSNLADMSPKDILSADRKRFTMGDYKVMVSQINTGDFKGMFKQLRPVLSEMEKACADEGFDLAVLMVTDIIMGGSEILVAGKSRKLAEAAFGIGENDISKFFPGVYSRKKQVVPPLMNASAL